MTQNGFTYNKEHLIRLSNCGAVSAIVEDFEQLWQKATPIDEDVLDRMLMQAEAKKERALKEKAERAEESKRQTPDSTARRGKEPDDDEESASASSSVVRKLEGTAPRAQSTQ